MSACQQGSAASHSGKHPRLRNDRDICCASDRRSPAMPEEYRHQVPPSKHPSAIDRSSVVRESWIVVSPGTMSPDQAQRPSLDTGSIRLVNPLAHPAPQSTQEFRPPPPLIDPNSRTSSAASIPHGASPPTAVMPSNPNYKPVPDLAHNGTTRERPSETPTVHVPATPREAIGHLDASQLHNKEDRESAVLRKRNRGSGMLGAVFGTHEPRSSMEDIDSIHSGVAQERERHSHSFRNFFGTSREREREKDRQRPVDMNDRAQWDMFHLIGYITSTNVEDWSVVMEVVDKVNQSDSEAREASKALRKDIQFGRPASQLAAARLWAILMRNCLTYFVAQTTSRKFLSRIEEVALNPNTPPVVRDRLVEVVGTSVYLLKESKHLKPYQATWKKLRMQLKLSHPADGLVINADDPILNPTPHRPPSSLRQYPGAEPVQPDPPLGVTGVARSIANLEIEPGREPGDLRDEERERERRRERSRKGEAAYGVISPEEDMRRLFEECDIAHDNCRILADSLVYATPDAVTVDPLIQEFRQKCIRSQEIIGAQIDWASAVADRARAEQISLVGPGEIVPTTSEEQLLHALVTANGELNDVFKTYDDLERIAISEREEAEVRERSRVELRIDRSKIQMLDGEVMVIPPDNHGPSRSQSHTPAPITVPLPSQTPTRRPLPQPAPPSPHVVNSLAPPPPAPHGPRPLSRNRTPSPKLGSDRGYDDSSQESDLPPAMPSEKAMGKRKAEPQPEEEDDWPDHNSLLPLDNGNDDDDDDSEPKPQEVFLYDAAEERKKQRAVQGR